jgi:Domain of Unknown Function (DUF1259)
MRAMKLLAIVAMTTVATAANSQGIDWQKVDAALGRTATVTGDVHRYGFPRSDLQVTVDGVSIRPAFALGGWAAFKPMGNSAMVMGDLVLLETEIKPVMNKLQEGGLEITALHNHLLRANPPTFYMHVGGHGDPEKLATALRAALAESKTPLTAPAAPAQQPAVDLDTAQLDQILGVKGNANGGCISSPCHGATRSPKTVCRLLPPVPWGWLRPSTSSPPAEAKRPSPATLSSLRRRSIR